MNNDENTILKKDGVGHKRKPIKGSKLSLQPLLITTAPIRQKLIQNTTLPTVESGVVAPPIVETTNTDPPIIEPVVELYTIAPSSIDPDGNVAESTTAKTTDGFPVTPLELGDGIFLNPLPANIDDPIIQPIVDVEQENARLTRIMRSIELSRSTQKSELSRLMELKKSLEHKEQQIKKREELFATEWDLIQVARKTYQTDQNEKNKEHAHKATMTLLPNENNKQYAHKATMTLPPNEVRQLLENNNTGKPSRLSRAVQRENRKKGKQQQQPDSRNNTKLDTIMAELVHLRQNQDDIQQQLQMQQPQIQIQQQHQQQLKMQQQHQQLHIQSFHQQQPHLEQQQPFQQPYLEQNQQQQQQHLEQQQPFQQLYLEQQQQPLPQHPLPQQQQQPLPQPQQQWRNPRTNSDHWPANTTRARGQNPLRRAYRSAPYIEGGGLNKHLQNTPYVLAPNMGKTRRFANSTIKPPAHMWKHY